MQSNAAELDVAVVRAELLVLDTGVVERLAEHEKVVGSEADAQLRHSDGAGGNAVVLVDRAPLEIHDGPVVVRWVGGSNVESGLHVPRQPELALRNELWLLGHRSSAAHARVAILELQAQLLERNE